MSERWWRRRKRWDPWFNDFFEESNRIENMMDDAMSQAFGVSKKKKKDRPYVFGFSSTPEPDENFCFRRFRDFQSNHYEDQIPAQCEPLVDVIEEDEQIVIVAELQGVKKEDIHIHATQCNITITVDTLEHKYHKELALPDKTEPESAVATYKNGVLQVRLKKLVATQPFVK